MARPRQPKPTTRPEATKLRERYAWLSRFSDEELRKISFCYEGDELDADGLYFDVNRPEVGPFEFRAGDRVPKGSCLIPESSVTPTIWRKLTAQPR